ncbi:5-oxoprolinase subunit PxpB [Alteromonas sediminis]|uniref:5-oxoprolinase subunit PxpB n=1 Tax=Alteromonas sediminis TaxID=2259342 RepID=A0A3N5YP92_9ALTE|nr:5-oxoprolinase subunit PxpB [Alteromonas sediminis]
MTIEPAAENALIIYFSSSPSPKTTHLIQSLKQGLQDSLDHKLIDLVPSFASLLVQYHTELTDHFEIKAAINCVWERVNTTSQNASAGKKVTLPVYYALETGPDLPTIAQQSGLSVSDVIQLHSSQEYLVYSIGFAPGFAYLGEVDARIATPRLATPRASVPKGSVGIADQQTAVYPASSPGGWNIIGKCPVDLFNMNKSPTMPYIVGDTVRFEAIDKETFLSLGGTL